jgi:hypothetical protein
MPSISYEYLTSWTNYHLTIGQHRTDVPAPAMTIHDAARVYAADTSPMEGLERFRETAAALLAYMKAQENKFRAAASSSALRPIQSSMVGTSWSFAPLIGGADTQISLDGLSGMSLARPADIHEDCKVDPKHLAFVSGGTRLRELVSWAERMGLSIETSGTHLGPTIAGAFGTASHGSRLGFGGIQDLIRGMHLITGEDKHVWIEPDVRPVLSEAAQDLLKVPDATLTVIRSKNVFDDALIHLGAMGIVNGVVIELVPSRRYVNYRVKKALGNDLLELISDGAFRQIAQHLGCNHEPQFYELTVDPSALRTEPALHMMYFYGQRSSASPVCPRFSPADAVAMIGHNLQSTSFPGDLLTAFESASAPNALNTRPLSFDDKFIRQALHLLLRMKAYSAFEFYRNSGCFIDPPQRFNPLDPNNPSMTWGELHSDDITGGVPGALYNASFAIERNSLFRALPLICDAVSDLPPSFVFTVRFVSHPEGTLAFTRFDENAVIEIDGLSALICEIAKRQIPQNHPYKQQLDAALDILASTVSTGAGLVRRALENAAIPYSMHWAKLGGLGAPNVIADFGPETTGSGSPIDRWRTTRRKLLTNFGMKFFTNDAIVNYGLIR